MRPRGEPHGVGHRVEGELLQVVAAHDELFLRRKTVDGVQQALAQLSQGHRAAEGLHAFVIALDHAGAFQHPADGQPDAHVGHHPQELLGVVRDPALRMQTGLVGDVLQAFLAQSLALGDLLWPLVQPLDPAQDESVHAPGGEGAELHAPRRVVAVERLEHADRSVLQEVLELHLVGKALRVIGGRHDPGVGQVQFEQLLSRRGISALPPTLPECGFARRCRCDRFHGLSGRTQPVP